MQALCWPIDLILSVVERPFVRNEPGFPIIFVVGIHRTGSTFVSQVLADSMQFAPLGNFTSIFPRSRHLIHKLFKRFYRAGKPSRPEKYRSFYGISKGFFSIGDSYEVWDKWFGKDHYNRPKELSPDKKNNMVEYFNSLQSAWGRPIITKNNRNTLILEMIHQNIPNAFIVLVNRNPADVIQSTIQASKDFFGTDEIIWGLREDPSFTPLNYKDKLDAYCHQYLDLQDSITKSLQSIPSEDYMVVQYESFCDDPNQVVKELSTKLSAKYDRWDHQTVSGSSKYFTSKRKYDTELSTEINVRIREIREKQGQ